MDTITIGGVSIAPGKRQTVDLPVVRLYTHTQLHMPVHVINSRSPGPVLFISAAIHGDELNGVEIIRRVLKLRGLRQMRGRLIAVPIVNVIGFIGHSRYLADRRDLNRVFPGAEQGPLALMLADLFIREVVAHATHGIDLHTATLHRNNFPQVRVSEGDHASLDLARQFNAPVIIQSKSRPGSLRHAIVERGLPNVLFEAGEALRFDETAIRVGVRGVLNVMRHLGMLPGRVTPSKRFKPAFFCKSSRWARSPSSGVLRNRTRLGKGVVKGQVLGVVADPFGENESDVIAPGDGYVIGRNEMPLVGKGDALYHVALAENLKETELDRAMPEEPDLVEAPGDDENWP